MESSFDLPPPLPLSLWNMGEVAKGGVSVESISLVLDLERTEAERARDRLDCVCFFSPLQVGLEGVESFANLRDFFGFGV